MKLMKATTAALLGACLLELACSHNSAFSPDTPPVPAQASPTISETFAGTLPVGGSKFYSFRIVANGSALVTLNSVTGTGVSPTVQLGLGIGTPAGTDCTPTSTVTAGTADTAPQTTATLAAGTYCVRINDLSPSVLVAPVAFNMTILHS
jgi:hypothetical protein